MKRWTHTVTCDSCGHVWSQDGETWMDARYGVANHFGVVGTDRPESEFHVRVEGTRDVCNACCEKQKEADRGH